MSFLRLPLKNELFFKIKNNLCNKSLEHLEESLETHSFYELALESEMYRRFATVCHLSTCIPVFNFIDIDSAIMGIYNLYFLMKSTCIASPDVRKSLKAIYKRKFLLPNVVYSELYTSGNDVLHENNSVGCSLTCKNNEINSYHDSNNTLSINNDCKLTMNENENKFSEFVESHSANDKYFKSRINNKNKYNVTNSSTITKSRSSKENNPQYTDSTGQLNVQIDKENKSLNANNHAWTSVDRLIKIHLLKEGIKLKRVVENGKLILFGKYFKYELILCGEILNPHWKIIDITLMNLPDEPEFKNGDEYLLKYFPNYQKETLKSLIDLDKMLSIHIDLKKIATADQNPVDQKIFFMTDSFMKISLDKILLLEISMDSFTKRLVIYPSEYESESIEYSIKFLENSCVEFIFNTFLKGNVKSNIYKGNENDECLFISHNNEPENIIGDNCPDTNSKNYFSISDIYLNVFEGLFIENKKINSMPELLKIKEKQLISLFNWKNAVFEDNKFIFQRKDTVLHLLIINLANDHLHFKIKLYYKDYPIPIDMNINKNEYITLWIDNFNKKKSGNTKLLFINSVNEKRSIFKSANQRLRKNECFLKIRCVEEFITNNIDLLLMVPELLKNRDGLIIQISNNLILAYENTNHVILIEIDIPQNPIHSSKVLVRIFDNGNMSKGKESVFKENHISEYFLAIDDISDILFIKDFILVLEYFKYYRLGHLFCLKRENQIIYGNFIGQRRVIFKDRDKDINNHPFRNNNIKNNHDFSISLKNLTLKIASEYQENTKVPINICDPLLLLKFLYLLRLEIYPRLYNEYFLLGNFKIRINDFESFDAFPLGINIFRMNNTCRGFKFKNKFSIDDMLLEIKRSKGCSFPCSHKFCFSQCQYFKTNNCQYSTGPMDDSSLVGWHIIRSINDSHLCSGQLQNIRNKIASSARFKIYPEELRLYDLLFKLDTLEKELKKHYFAKNGIFFGKSKFMLFIKDWKIQIFICDETKKKLEEELNFVVNFKNVWRAIERIRFSF